MAAIIFKPSKTAMQSGKAKTDNWVLQFDETEPRKIEPLMGYTSSSDMLTQVKLEFESLDAAKTYAEKNGIAYRVQKPHVAKRRVMSYAENFSTDRTLPWTH